MNISTRSVGCHSCLRTAGITSLRLTRKLTRRNSSVGPKPCRSLTSTNCPTMSQRTRRHLRRNFLALLEIARYDLLRHGKADTADEVWRVWARRAETRLGGQTGAVCGPPQPFGRITLFGLVMQSLEYVNG